MVTVKILKALFIFLKAVFLFAALVYFFGFGVQISNAEWLEYINGYIGFLPAFFDFLIDYTIQVSETVSFTLGYILSCIFFLILLLFAIIGRHICDETLNEHKIKTSENELHQHVKGVFEKLKTKESPPPDRFFGLFEFLFQGHDEIDLEDLRTKYTTTIFSKLKSKYKSIEFEINKNGQIQFLCGDFSKFDMIVDDILKFYSAFLGINKTSARLCLKFAICGGHEGDNRRSFAILREISKLNYLNKIVVNQEICRHSKENNFSRFNFLSLGTVKFMKKLRRDVDIELFRLANPHVSKWNDK